MFLIQKFESEYFQKKQLKKNSEYQTNVFFNE